MRVAHKFEEIFYDCPYEGGYDLKIGISEKGEYADLADFSKHENFEHALLFFGGLEGIEGLFE